MQYETVPDMAQISALQRQPKQIFRRVKKRKTVFITERGNPSAVLLDINLYKDLVKSANSAEKERILHLVEQGAKEAILGSDLEDFDTFLESQ